MILQRITREDLVEFYEDFYDMIYPEYRLGEAFLTRFFVGITDSILFNETDNDAAMDYIEEHYVVQ